MSKKSATLLGLAATLALSAPALAGPCTTGKFSAYEAKGFSCTVGDKTFSSFNYTQNTPNSPAASQVTVTPVSVGNEEGFNFSANWALLNTGTLDDSWGYKVATTNGKPLIIDAVNAVVGAVGAPGFGTVAENATFPTGSSTTLNVSLTGKHNNKKTFAPVSSLLISKDLSEIAGKNGFVTISVDQQLYSQLTVPEPASLALVGVGLAGIGLVRRRRSK